METANYCDPSYRQDFVLIFEVTDGNPNGDPDAGNLPRVDPETMQGLVTDVCLKRKVRDYVDATNGDQANFKIYVQNKGIALNTLHERAYEDLKLKSTGTKQKREDVDQTRAWMCRNFFDIRTFGAVMTTEVNCGQVRGPVQLTFARSVDPIIPLDLSITRVAITKKQDIDFVETEKGTEGGKVTEMGRKALVPYGLYVGYGFVNAHFAAQTGFSVEDLTLFWEALQQMWDLDRSASRGRLACRGLYVFTHDSKLGKAPAHKLFDLIKVSSLDAEKPPRQFKDYEVTLPESASLPEGVTLTVLEG
jgi:CRISPR-associated protein Csd2